MPVVRTQCPTELAGEKSPTALRRQQKMHVLGTSRALHPLAIGCPLC